MFFSLSHRGPYITWILELGKTAISKIPVSGTVIIYSTQIPTLRTKRVRGNRVSGGLLTPCMA